MVENTDSIPKDYDELHLRTDSTIKKIMAPNGFPPIISSQLNSYRVRSSLLLRLQIQQKTQKAI